MSFVHVNHIYHVGIPGFNIRSDVCSWGHLEFDQLLKGAIGKCWEMFVTIPGNSFQEVGDKEAYMSLYNSIWLVEHML